LQQSASELFRPITNTFQKTQKKTDEKQDKIIKNIKEQLANTQLAIENIPQASYTANFEKFFSDEEKQLLADEDFEINLTEVVNDGRDFINDLITKTATTNKNWVVHGEVVVLTKMKLI